VTPKSTTNLRLHIEEFNEQSDGLTDFAFSLNTGDGVCRERTNLDERLEAVLKGGAEALGCQAAGLYLLDDATSELKLRACWGLPDERLLGPARPLRGLVADLEALVGHAVVLEDTSLLPHWRCPEDFPSAVCLPVASPSMPLGTLWVFSQRQRDFTPEQTNLLEIIAGRLAADLEHDSMTLTTVRASRYLKQLDSATHWFEDRLPTVMPLLDEYEVAGWTQPAGVIGGAFHDWTVLADGRLALAVAAADGSPLEAALSAASLRGSLQAHVQYRHSARQLLERLNESMLVGSPGNERGSAAYALLETECGEVELALAGDSLAVVLTSQEPKVLLAATPAIGESPETAFRDVALQLTPGDAAVLVSGGQCGEEFLTDALNEIPRSYSAELLLQAVRDEVLRNLDRPRDLSIAVVKRRSHLTCARKPR